MASHVCLSMWSQQRGEPPRCSRAWRGVLCLGFVSTDGEGMVSEDISCSRIPFVQTRKKASCLGKQCGQFRCSRVGAMLHVVKYKFIKIHIHQKPLSSKTTFIKNHFHQKTTFIKKPVSSKTSFIKNHFHQKPFSSEKNETQGWDSQYSPCLCEGVAGRRPATPSHKHGLCPPFGFQQAFMWSIAGLRPVMLHMKVS